MLRMGAPVYTPRPQIVCLACRVGKGLVHGLITLHAGEETIIICEAAMEALPKWMRDGWTQIKEVGRRQGLDRRRNAAREIREHLNAEYNLSI